MGSVGYVDPWVLAENVEFLDTANWNSYHMQKGLGINESAVSMGTSLIIGMNIMGSSRSGSKKLDMIM